MEKKKKYFRKTKIKIKKKKNNKKEQFKYFIYCGLFLENAN
jgi:hypothetical protein